MTELRTGCPKDGITARPNRLEALIDQAACRYPDTTALDIGGAATSYDALLANAGRIAQFIRAARGKIPARIGLIGTRSASSYAAYAAVLGLGSTIVPISSAVPAERALLIAETAQLDLVVTASSLPAFEERARVRGITVLRLPDADAELSRKAVARSFDTGAAPQSVAYILFTSGSTGRPRGVPISHDNALSFVRHSIAQYGLGPGCRMTQTFDLSFDVSVYDIFAALGSGATLVVPAAADLLHPVRWVSQRQITHWASVPSVISAARGLGELAPASMPTVRLSLFIGEQLSLEQAEAWHLATPYGTVENFYGPTELTVGISSYRLPDDVARWPDTGNRTVPIGRVYDHLESVILGTSDHPDTGELVVRGPQRFAGYLDPRDNAGRFVALEDGTILPFDGSGPLTPGHWYRTGDVVHRQPDGVLVHLGRLDAQVKIRGFRVELPEIEGALRLHPDVDDAAVLATPGALGNQELTAFYTGRPADPRDIREALSRTLPAYMIPRRVLHLPYFPLTISGKIDRLTLASRLASGKLTVRSRPDRGEPPGQRGHKNDDTAV